MSVIIHRKAAEQYLVLVLFDVQFSPVCNFGKLIRFRLGTVKMKGLSMIRNDCT